MTDRLFFILRISVLLKRRLNATFRDFEYIQGEEISVSISPGTEPGKPSEI